MASPGIIIVAGAAYMGGYYGVALCILLYSIVNGGLAAVYAIANPAWYQMQCAFAGVNPNMGSLLLAKATLLAIQVPAAIHIGRIGGSI